MARSDGVPWVTVGQPRIGAPGRECQQSEVRVDDVIRARDSYRSGSICNVVRTKFQSSPSAGVASSSSFRKAAPGRVANWPNVRGRTVVPDTRPIRASRPAPFGDSVAAGGQTGADPSIRGDEPRRAFSERILGQMPRRPGWGGGGTRQRARPGGGARPMAQGRWTPIGPSGSRMRISTRLPSISLVELHAADLPRFHARCRR
jgi:hypothetical protein